MHGIVTINLIVNNDESPPEVEFIDIGTQVKMCMRALINGIIIELHHDMFTTEKPEVYTMGNQLCVHSSTFTKPDKYGEMRRLCDISFINYDIFNIESFTVLEQMYPKPPSASLFIFVPFRDEFSSEGKPAGNQTDRQVAVVDETKAE